MIRRWLPFIVGAGFVVWVAALVMLAMTAEGPQRFGELYLAILLVNITGVVALLVVIGRRLADFVRDGTGVLAKVSLIVTVCCVLVAFITSDTSRLFTAAVFMVFGATAVGWNGVFMAEIARCSPRGQVSVATGGAMVWNFAGILVGPATFATVYGLVGSYAVTFGTLALIAAAGCTLLVSAASAAQKAVAH